MDAQAGTEVVLKYISHTELFEALCAIIDEDIDYERRKRPDGSDVLREIRETLKQQDRIQAFEKIKQRFVFLHEKAMNDLKQV